VPTVLLLATTTGYQTRAFDEAAGRLGIDLVYATDRCDMLDDPWRDEAIPIRFHDESASAAAIVEAAKAKPIDGVIAAGDRPTVIAALVNEALGRPGHPPHAAAVSRNKLLTREALKSAGLSVPWFFTVPIVTDLGYPSSPITFPCVVKPLALSGSRGVMRADNQTELTSALDRLRALLRLPDIRVERNAAHDWAVVEGFIEGREFAVEGVMNHGSLDVLAIFDKPDPLDGPFFEETIYVTPSRAGGAVQEAIVNAVGRAARAIGLRHGPIHAECRIAGDTSSGRAVAALSVFVLEVAARPIGGLCARALRFVAEGDVPCSFASLEELLLRHALGESSTRWTREASASGVMMIPIRKRGVLRQVSGVDRARAVAGVEDVRITAKADQMLHPLPEGAAYLGFIFARAESPAEVERALRDAETHLEFTIDPEVRMLQSRHG
jgi:biotin carboxylase